MGFPTQRPAVKLTRNKAGFLLQRNNQGREKPAGLLWAREELQWDFSKLEVSQRPGVWARQSPSSQATNSEEKANFSGLAIYSVISTGSQGFSRCGL